jgi:hypothetical protein
VQRREHCIFGKALFAREWLGPVSVPMWSHTNCQWTASKRMGRDGDHRKSGQIQENWHGRGVAGTPDVRFLNRAREFESPRGCPIIGVVTPKYRVWFSGCCWAVSRAGPSRDQYSGQQPAADALMSRPVAAGTRAIPRHVPVLEACGVCETLRQDARELPPNRPTKIRPGVASDVLTCPVIGRRGAMAPSVP